MDENHARALELYIVWWMALLIVLLIYNGNPYT